jgi:hypothetical protein
LKNDTICDNIRQELVVTTKESKDVGCFKV